MNKKHNLSQQQTTPRRTRQQSRNSPNSKLLNAAWPKPPSNPTRKSHIKAVDHDPFKKSWNEWRQQNSECCVEDMEVDVDTNNEDEMTKSSSSGGSNTSGKKTTPPKLTVNSNQEKPSCSLSKSVAAEKSNKPLSATSPNRQTLRARRSLGEGAQETKKNIHKGKETVRSKAKPNSKEEQSRRMSSSLYIVIHASEVMFGSCKGPATTPVKVYADKFIIQMEDNATKKEIGFRVPCKNILSLNVSLQQKPFTIEFTTKVIQYLTDAPPYTGRAKGGNEPKKICLHLGYEDCVPQDVKKDLRELFEVRLAELNLWKDQFQNAVNCSVANIGDDQNKKEDKEQEQEEEEEGEEQKEVSEDKKTSSTDKVKQTTVKEQEEVSVEEKEKHPQPVTTTKERRVLPAVRKRTPVKKMVTVEHLKEEIEPTSQQKIARRCDFEQNDTMQERIKTLEHEAAHYQMVTAQQRMIIQRLESTVQMSAQKAESDSNMLKQQRDQLSEEFVNKQLELTGILNNLKIEKDLVKALESQIETYRNELDTKNSVIAEKNEALQVREDTILQLRGRVRRLSTTEKKENSNDAPNEQQMVALSQLEDVRNQLMQAEISNSQLNTELEQLRLELLEKDSRFHELRVQLEDSQTECRTLTETVERLRADSRTTQTVIEQKNEQLRNLEAISNTENEQRVGEVQNELANSNMLNEELQAELTELKSQIEEMNRQQSATPASDQQTLSRDWILERREITLTENILGTGAWGNVKIGNFRGTDVAVKQIHLLILSPHNRRLFEREMAIASRCRHPCLVQFIGATNDDGTPLFVMELLTTDLRSVLSREPLSQPNCLNIGYDVIRAIVYLHKSKPVPIIHRDISSSNVLLYKGEGDLWRAKLSDYGAANFVRLSMTRHPGGLLYSAPEASTMDQTTKIDVYSFGVLFCEMCTRELPVPENRCDQIRSVANPDYRTLVSNCLRRDVARRLESDVVLGTFERWITQQKTNQL